MSSPHRSPTGPMRRTATAAVTVTAASLLAPAGCGSSGSGGSASPSAPPSGSAAPSATAPATGAALMTTHSAKLGTIVTDSAGWTLYRFDKDSANPSRSNCTGQCAAIWPAAAAVTASQVRGIDQKLIGSVTRADDTKQVTLGGRPLYRYSGDKKPGDINGQGVMNTWYAVTPQGAGATSATQPSNTGDSTGTSGSGGYGY